MSNPFFPTFNKNDLIKGLNDGTGYAFTVSAALAQ